MKRSRIKSPPRGPTNLTKKQVKEAVRKVMDLPKPKQKNRIQVLNSKSGRYVKINTETGEIVQHKKSPGPFQDVVVVLLPRK